MKVGLIKEQQSALEQAAAKGRDHLSWEEVDELASQEEACRAQLDHPHLTWTQKDMCALSLTKMETNYINSLASSNPSLVTSPRDQVGKRNVSARWASSLSTIKGRFFRRRFWSFVTCGIPFPLSYESVKKEESGDERVLS